MSCMPVPLTRSLQRLEPDEGKLSRPVLRGGDGSNAISLPAAVSITLILMNHDHIDLLHSILPGNRIDQFRYQVVSNNP